MDSGTSNQDPGRPGLVILPSGDESVHAAEGADRVPPSGPPSAAPAMEAQILASHLTKLMEVVKAAVSLYNRIESIPIVRERVFTEWDALGDTLTHLMEAKK